MDDDLPDFGDVVGLTRVYRAARESIRAADLPEADRRAWLAELQRAWREAHPSPGRSDHKSDHKPLF